MTNKEKFQEVFGDEPQRQYATKSWWEQEYVPTTHDYMLVCPKCGLDVHSDFESCPRCGENLKARKHEERLQRERR